MIAIETTMKLKGKKAAFTIVELLIVIVVIAILAAITIVVYSGMQTRANNTQTIDAVKKFVKAYHLYAIDNGDYPNASGCLGEGYPGPNNWCLSQNGAVECWGLGATNNTAINTALKPYMNGKVPLPSMQQVACGSTSYIGAYAYYSSGSKTVGVVMILKGDQACPVMSPSVSSSSRSVSGEGTRCSYTLAAAQT